MSEENPLTTYFQSNRGRLIHKWGHYFDIYHRHFSPFRGAPIRMLEFGVFHGGSLQMWKNYFGPTAEIIGVDIDPRCRTLSEDRVTIEIGDQEDRTFLRDLAARRGPFDLVVDDGGHTMPQQISTFEEIYPSVTANGIYLVEDLLTSYRPNYAGGVRRRGTFIEYSKGLIDQLNAWHSHELEVLSVDEFTRTTYGLHYYDSVLVVEKRPISQPWHKKTGVPSF